MFVIYSRKSNKPMKLNKANNTLEAVKTIKSATFFTDRISPAFEAMSKDVEIKFIQSNLNQEAYLDNCGYADYKLINSL